MSSTAIPYATRALNPLVGCPLPLVSPGCANCWARELHNRRNEAHGRGKNLPAMYARNFNTLQWFPERLEEAYTWRKPQTVAVCFQSDLFHPDVLDEWIDEVFSTMAYCHRHTFLLLTKRPERMRDWCSNVTSRRPVPGHGVCTGGPPFCGCAPESGRHHDAEVGYCGTEWPLRNVYLGVTVCTQAEADAKIPVLLQTPAAHRWASIEPMLGEINLRRFLPFHIGTGEYGLEKHRTLGLDWIVVGGESGSKARPMHPEWVRSVRDQCQAAGVKFYFKQWGEWWPFGQSAYRPYPKWKGKHQTFIVNDSRTQTESIYRVGTSCAGHQLDGREWRELPWRR